MGDFLEVALSFPTVVFSFLLLVLVLYWLLVLLGALDLDVLDDIDLDLDVDGADGAGDGGLAGVLAGLGLAGPPVTVVLSLLVLVAWFVCLVGTALLDGPVLVAVLVAALATAYVTTRAAVVPLRRVFPDLPGPSRSDLVGRVCVIRTGRVDDRFGQAEVTAADGSSAIVQVRVANAGDGADLRAGTRALIYAFEDDGEFFFVSPVDGALDPHN